jgi:hypothetical protein
MLWCRRPRTMSIRTTTSVRESMWIDIFVVKHGDIDFAGTAFACCS